MWEVDRQLLLQQMHLGSGIFSPGVFALNRIRFLGGAVTATSVCCSESLIVKSMMANPAFKDGKVAGFFCSQSIEFESENNKPFSSIFAKAVAISCAFGLLLGSQTKHWVATLKSGFVEWRWPLPEPARLVKLLGWFDQCCESFNKSACCGNMSAGGGFPNRRHISNKRSFSRLLVNANSSTANSKHLNYL